MKTKLFLSSDYYRLFDDDFSFEKVGWARLEGDEKALKLTRAEKDKTTIRFQIARLKADAPVAAR